jgi:neural Wiskott-Aldrich syndrome protein
MVPPPRLADSSEAQISATQPTRGRGAKRNSVEALTSSRMIEFMPRRMQSHVPSSIEVRLAKADVRALVDGLSGGGNAFQVAPAMSVRLRAPDGGFLIELASPETQWIDVRSGMIEADFVSWHWTVTPLMRGARRLNLAVVTRTVGADGGSLETALPDQMVDVRVKPNTGRALSRAALWCGVALLGGLLATFGKGLAEPVIAGVMVLIK